MLIIKANLAISYRNLGELGEVKALYHEILGAYRRLSLANHPKAHKYLINLATVLRLDRDLERAERLGKQAVADYTKSLGPDSRETLLSLTALA